jgi:Flp pilus assembly protein TadD
VTDRLDRMRALAAASPGDARLRYFLAHELFRAGAWEEAADSYRAYLELEPRDEGTGWKNLGLALEKLGRTEDAADAYRKGIEVALTFQHEALASEIRFFLDELET